MNRLLLFASVLVISPMLCSTSATASALTLGPALNPASGSALATKSPCGTSRPDNGRYTHITREYIAQAEARFLRALNAYRNTKGLSPLRLNPLIRQAAIGHAKDMASGDFMSHKGSDGSSSFDRIQRTGYPARYAAENIGVGQTSVEKIFEAWQKSAGHDRNLLSSNAKEMSLALVYRDSTVCRTYWVLNLGAAFSVR